MKKVSNPPPPEGVVKPKPPPAPPSARPKPTPTPPPSIEQKISQQLVDNRNLIDKAILVLIEKVIEEDKRLKEEVASLKEELQLNHEDWLAAKQYAGNLEGTVILYQAEQKKIYDKLCSVCRFELRDTKFIKRMDKRAERGLDK